MRCQWGVDADHMTPWMVARRYREFDALDKVLLEQIHLCFSASFMHMQYLTYSIDFIVDYCSVAACSILRVQCKLVMLSYAVRAL
jgi:hypothetical protein